MSPTDLGSDAIRVDVDRTPGGVPLRIDGRVVRVRDGADPSRTGLQAAADRARRLGRPIRVDLAGPWSTWPLVVHPDGGVDDARARSTSGGRSVIGRVWGDRPPSRMPRRTALACALAAVLLCAGVAGGMVVVPAAVGTGSCRPVTLFAVSGRGPGSAALTAVTDAVSRPRADSVAVAAVPAPEGPAYPAAEQKAVDGLAATLASQAASCPDGRIMLLGWSEGAQVAGDLASRIGTGQERGVPATRVAAVGLFGDPARSGSARVVPANTPGQGILPPRGAGFGALASRTIEVCAPDDPVCASRPEQASPSLEQATAAPAHAGYGTLVVAPNVTSTQWAGQSLGRLTDSIRTTPQGGGDTPSVPAGRGTPGEAGASAPSSTSSTTPTGASGPTTSSGPAAGAGGSTATSTSSSTPSVTTTTPPTSGGSTSTGSSSAGSGDSGGSSSSGRGSSSPRSSTPSSGSGSSGSPSSSSSSSSGASSTPSTSSSGSTSSTPSSSSSSSGSSGSSGSRSGNGAGSATGVLFSMTNGMAGFHPPGQGDVEDGGRQPQNAASPNVPGRQAIKVDVPSGAMRSEIEPGGPTAHIQSGSHMFFGLSDFIPQGFPVNTSGYQVIWQLHDGGTNSSPPVALEIQAGHLRLANVGAYIADLGPVTPGQNLALQIEVQFAERGGSVSVWANGKQVATTVKPPKGTMVDSFDYLKLGVYKHKTSEDADASLFVNDVKVGNSFESVATLAGAAPAGASPAPADPNSAGTSNSGTGGSSGGGSSGDTGSAESSGSGSSGSGSSGSGSGSSGSGTASTTSTGAATATGAAMTTGAPATGAAATGAAATGAAATAGKPPSGLRDVRRQPFSWDSIWNLPLSEAATYAPAGVAAQRLYPDIENISVDPDAPVKQLGGVSSGRVHVAPDMTADGHWNNCSTLLMDTPDRTTVIQGQPMKLTAGGDPTWAYAWDPLSLTSRGEPGCHGGSGLSGIGGTIRDGELPGPEPIRHALKISLPCERACSAQNDGHRWPATKADSGFRDNYGGSNPQVLMGSLLALPADADLSGISEPDVRKVAEALRTYGGYVVDSSGGPTTGSFDVQSTAVPEFPNIDSEAMRRLFGQLSVITNNAAATPGGGALDAPRRAPCAPPFADGSGAPPGSCGSSTPSAGRG